MSTKKYVRLSNFRMNIRLLRAQAGYPAEEMGRLVGFDKKYRFIYLERGSGNPKKKELEMLSKYFNIPVDELVNKKAIIVFQ